MIKWRFRTNVRFRINYVPNYICCQVCLNCLDLLCMEVFGTLRKMNWLLLDLPTSSQVKWNYIDLYHEFIHARLLDYKYKYVSMCVRSLHKPAGPSDVVALTERLVRAVVCDPGSRRHERRLAPDAAAGREAVLPAQHRVRIREAPLSQEMRALYRLLLHGDLEKYEAATNPSDDASERESSTRLLCFPFQQQARLSRPSASLPHSTFHTKRRGRFLSPIPSPPPSLPWRLQLVCSNLGEGYWPVREQNATHFTITWTVSDKREIFILKKHYLWRIDYMCFNGVDND